MQKIDLKLLNSLEKVLLDEEPMGEFAPQRIFKNERFNFQVATYNTFFEITSAFFIKINSKIKDKIKIFRVENAPVVLANNENSDDYIISRESKMYPDILEPLNEENLFVLPPKKWISIWFTVEGDLPLNNNEIEIEIVENDTKISNKVALNLYVIDEKLPKSDLIVTTWVHYDCICQKHNVEPFSKEFYDVFNNYLKNFVKHGNTMLFTPLFTPPLNTLFGKERMTTQLISVKYFDDKYFFNFDKLNKFIDVAKDNSVEYFEMSHLFTQWGSEFCPKIIVETKDGMQNLFGWNVKSTSEEYTKFLSIFLPELIKYLEEKEIYNNVYFHLSDEPTDKNLDNYSKIHALVKKYLGDAKTLDALTDYKFYKMGLVDRPVVTIDNAEPFMKNAKNNYWVYYCWAQSVEYVSNRFITMPSQRNRILGMQLYLNDVQGFLQWGYNYYNTAFSEREVDPFYVTDCDKKFPSGDAFIVYPDIKNKGVFNSLRNEVFFDGIQDYLALKLLEKYTNREYVVDLLKKEGMNGFKCYKRSSKWHLEFREKINKLIQEKL